MIAKYLTYECKKKVTSASRRNVSSEPGNDKGAAPGLGNFKLKFSFLAAGLNIIHSRLHILEQILLKRIF